MAPYNLKNPSVISVPNPIDMDLAIETLQEKLADGLPWLEKVFGRAREIPRKSADGKTIERHPMVYQSGGEYYPPLPNDALKSYSFFMAGQPRMFDESKPFDPIKFINSPIALIVWGNLKRIDPSVDYIFTERLINQTVSILNRNAKIELVRLFDENSREVFRGLTLNETHQGLLMYPYFAFRIEMNLKFQMTCPTASVG
jgi:hypothetical protein